MSKLYYFSIIIIVFFTACASNADVAKLESFYFENKNLEDSYKYAARSANRDFLWAMQSGILAMQSGDFAKSMEYFNRSEVFFEENRSEGLLYSGFKNLVTILLSNSIFDYYGNLHEAVLVNYYKAIDAIMLGDYATSRVEFNRANDRQRRAKEFFAKRIQEVNESINNGKKFSLLEMPSLDTQKTDKSIDSIYSQYKNLDKYKAFEGYVNPMVSYLSGIFFLTQNDFNKANDLLKEAYAISQKEEVLRDLEILEQRERGQNREFYTWVIIEDGQIPKKYEMRIDAPLFLLNSGVFYFNLALPNLDNGRSFVEHYHIAGRGVRYDGFEITNIEAIVANEFSVELPYIIITSLISSSYKAYLQYFLNENFGILGSLGGAIFSLASTNADIRSPRILPLRFIVLRIKNTEGIFYVYDNRKKMYNFTLSNKCLQLCVDRDNIVYLRNAQNVIISNLTHSIGEKK